MQVYTLLGQYYSTPREEEYPTLFYNPALNAAQRNYSTYERELLAVVKACDAFTVYLLRRELTLCTDHSASSAICNSLLSSRSRKPKWLLALQPFLFTVNHINGEKNVVADRLSRITSLVAVPIALEIVRLTGEIGRDTDT